jgi:hypothetical protein
MNPQLMKLLARMKGMGAKGVEMGDKAMGAAGAGMGSLAGMAARNPKTAAGIGAAGAGGVGAGMAMGDEEEEGLDIEELLAMIEATKSQGQGLMQRGRSALGM